VSTVDSESGQTLINSLRRSCRRKIIYIWTSFQSSRLFSWVNSTLHSLSVLFYN